MTIKKLFEDIAKEIRLLTHTTDKIKATDFPAKIRAIPADEGISGFCGANKSDVLAGKTAVTNDSENLPAYGTMLDRGAVNHNFVYDTVNDEWETYTIPDGYHNGSGKVTCSIPDDDGGTYTVDPASAEEPTAYEADKEVVPAGTYCKNAVKVAGLAFENLLPANITEGTTVTIKTSNQSSASQTTLKSVTGTAKALTSGTGSANSYAGSQSFTYTDNARANQTNTFPYYEIALGDSDPVLIHGTIGNNNDGIIFWCRGMANVFMVGSKAPSFGSVLEFAKSSLYDSETHKIKIPQAPFYDPGPVSVSLNWYAW